MISIANTNRMGDIVHPHFALLHRCILVGCETHAMVAVVQHNAVLHLLGNPQELHGKFNQCMKNRTTGVCKIKPHYAEVSSQLLRILNGMPYHTGML